MNQVDRLSRGSVLRFWPLTTFLIVKLVVNMAEMNQQLAASLKAPTNHAAFDI